MKLPRFISKIIPGFEVYDVIEWLKPLEIETLYSTKSSLGKAINRRLVEIRRFTIKERILHLFHEKTEIDALWVLTEVEDWIKFNKFENLGRWFRHFMNNWETFKNYFTYLVTSASAEGVNNVIKSIKRRGFGYRNMTYFKLKILQVCGYLNSDYIASGF